MTVYLLTSRGTIHKAIQTADGERMTFEGDNLDVAKVTVYDDLAQVPSDKTKKLCRRCFP